MKNMNTIIKKISIIILISILLIDHLSVLDVFAEESTETTDYTESENEQSVTENTVSENADNDEAFDTKEETDSNVEAESDPEENETDKSDEDLETEKEDTDEEEDDSLEHSNTAESVNENSAEKTDDDSCSESLLEQKCLDEENENEENESELELLENDERMNSDDSTSVNQAYVVSENSASNNQAYSISENSVSDNSVSCNEIPVIVTDDTERYNDSGEDVVTRLAWLEMLIEVFDISVEEDNYPDNYYADVNSADSYYREIMVATEFGLVDTPCGGAVDVDGATSREFAARTLNICIGYINQCEYSFSESENVDYPDDIQIAIDHDWFELNSGSFMPDKAITLTEFDRLKNVAEDAYESTQIDPNFESGFTLKPGVKNLGKLRAYTTGENEITVYNSNLSELYPGDKFVILFGEMPFAYKAVGVTLSGANTVIEVEEVELDEVFEDIDVQTVKDVDFEDILIQTSDSDVHLSYIVGGTPEKNYDDGIEYENINDVGIKEVSAVRVYKDIPLKFKTTGVHEWNPEDGMSVKASVTISKLKFESACSISSGKASVGVRGEIETELGIKMDLDEFVPISWSEIEEDLSLKILICPGVYFDVKPHFDISGKISICMEHSFYIKLALENGDFRIINELVKKKFTIEAQVEVDIGITAELTFDMIAMKGTLFASIGAKSVVKIIKHNDFPNCVDLSAFVYFDVGAYAKTRVPGWNVKIEARYEIWHKKNSPARIHLHFEDGVQVDECTRLTEAEKQEARNSRNPNVLYGYYYTPIDSQYGYTGYLNTGRSSTGETFTIFEYDLNDSNEATIKKYNGNVSVLRIPDTIDGYNVIGIGKDVFADKDALVSVIMSDNITDIGSNAFAGCTNLKIVDLSSNLKTLGYRAFSDCTSLEMIDIPKSLEKVSGNVNGFTFRGPFYNCTSLRTINFSEGTVSVCDYLFDGCMGLRKVTIPNSIVCIGGCAFKECKNLEVVEFSDSVSEIKKSAFYGCSKLNNVVLPSNLTTIGKSAFADCTELESIIIPKSVIDVDERYAAGYASLSMTGAPLNNMGPFEGCTKLVNIEFEYGATQVPDYICAGCEQIESITIPDTVTSIGGQAFYNCTNLSKIEIGNSVTTIGEGAFCRCISVTEFNLTDSITKIGNFAFAECTGITSMDLPKNLSILGKCAFCKCTNLERIYIPKSLTRVYEFYMGGYSVGGCLNNGGPFTYCDSLKTIEIEEGKTEINSYLFAKCTGLEEIELPSSIEIVGEQAFDGCDSLSSIIFNQEIEEISKAAFGNCTALVSVDIPQSVVYMGDACFSECSSLERISLPNGRVNIVEKMFQGCVSLKNIELPESVEAIRAYAFDGCSSLEEISIPSGVTIIEKYAFSNCDSLEGVLVLSEKDTTIGDYAFHNCDNLRKIVFSDNVTTIGNCMLDTCKRLQEVELGKGVKAIPKNCFSNCESLERIILPYNVTSIGDNAFQNDIKLIAITIPRGTNAISTSAFSYKDRLVIYGVSGTFAETFAHNNGYNFVSQETNATSVTFDQDIYYIFNGQSLRLSYKVTPDDYTDEMTWVVSKNSDKVTVTQDGIITGLKVTADGSPAVVKLSVGDCITSCKIVVQQPVTSIRLNRTSCTLDAGTTFQLSTSVSPLDATDKTITWKSSDESVAIVDDNGQVTALSKGNCIITATAVGGVNKSCTCSITVANTMHKVDDIADMASPHPYPTNSSDIWSYTVEGASRISVTFTNETNLEEDTDGDYIVIMDSQGNVIGEYYGSDLSGKSITIPGDTAQIQLFTDSLNSKDYGFSVAKIESIDESDAIGDINGDDKINAADRIYLARYLAGWVGYNLENQDVADVNHDGKVNAADRIYLARYLAGWSGYVL